MLDLRWAARRQRDGGLIANDVPIPCEHIMAAAVLLAQNLGPRTVSQALSYCRVASGCNCEDGPSTVAQCSALGLGIRLSNAWRAAQIELPTRFQWDEQSALRLEEAEAKAILAALGLDDERAAHPSTTAPVFYVRESSRSPSQDSDATCVHLDLELDARHETGGEDDSICHAVDLEALAILAGCESAG